MTHEQQIEWRYRYEERLGILCGSAKPTPRQIDIATREADAWLKAEQQREKKKTP